MKADRVEVSWDQDKRKWLVRIVVGEEVIRRYTAEPANADQQMLRVAASQVAGDEGYQVDSDHISVV